MSVSTTQEMYKDLNMLMNKEIGSEFWLDYEPSSLSSERDGLYVLSGRTAIDIIIQDITSYKYIKSIYLPAYCCDSMIFPFTKRGIEVNLYDVGFDRKLQYHIDKSIECDIFYVNNYFGYENTIDLNIIEHFKNNGAVVFYDKTHSFMMKNDNLLCDYSFASIRKWMGVVGGAIINGTKNYSLKEYPYLSCKEKAMRQKKAYIAGDNTISKEDFLKSYADFGHHLQEDYMDYGMDDLSYTIYKNTNINQLKDIRIRNAKYLHGNLTNVNFLCELTDNACPLFVPVVFNTKEERDFVRKTLIDNQIFCPVHWPKNNHIAPEMKVNKIFDTELSLICDQRYSLNDMNRIVNVINTITK